VVSMADGTVSNGRAPDGAASGRPASDGPASHGPSSDDPAPEGTVDAALGGARLRGERGSGTVLMLVLVTLGGFLITVTLALAGAFVARHRAGAIADLAALAAASVPPGPESCERARRIAEANAGRLLSCSDLGDGSVRVDVGLVGAPGPLLGAVTGSARAGPGRSEGEDQPNRST
jgi:secretion/DNA translocation related TadE-like protein